MPQSGTLISSPSFHHQSPAKGAQHAQETKTTMQHSKPGQPIRIIKAQCTRSTAEPIQDPDDPNKHGHWFHTGGGWGLIHRCDGKLKGRTQI